MLIPIRILSLLVLLILIAQHLPNTNSYQGGKFATKRCNSAPKRETLANNGGENEAAVIRGNKRTRPQMAYAEKFTKEKNNIVASKQEMVDLNVKGEQIMSRRPLTHQDNAGYVAFTADYKSPRHHPPRHN
ncbi:protein GOLVEN 5-like [Lycium barbarum]|uniref:protein GOLVEN 5-like n=1 Tax=Lycium barbarum TaxID=112863 RepID=UPI00293F1BC9|nr:protein GOLVEN 5-like [Lycium barbarum]